MKLSCSNRIGYPLGLNEVDIPATQKAPVYLLTRIPEWGTRLEIGGFEQLLQERFESVATGLSPELMNIQ